MFLSDGGLFSLIPTLLFILIILLSIIFGILRGFRKSVILGIQALVAFVACLIAYFVIVNNAQTDTNIVNIANAFLGDGGLQNTLGVSTNNSSLTDIIMELILNNTNMGNGMALVLEENGAYLMAITNLVYHIVFFVLLWIVYLLLVFIFYIIYLIFYPERRHSRKVNKKYQETDPDKKYKKHRIFGGAIGALRGIVAGFMVMSVIGAIFYVVGGTGEGEYKEYDWGDDTYNTTYSIYSQTGSYGNSGIFKVLNTIKDQDNVPFYLFMANNLLSGNSYEGELKSNLVLSKDLGAVTVFARSSFDLILKYGKEDIISAIKESGNSEEGSNKLLQVIGNVYSNIEFQNEFNKLIDDFNTNTFFIDMTFSVLDSFVNHMNEMTLTESLPKDTVELLNVLFNKNYISPYIPDDQANFEANGEVATIKPNMLLQKEDVKVAFKITFNVLSNESTNDQVLDTVNLATTVMDDIDELSLLNSKNKDNFNPVFERLYIYLSNYYLSEDPKEEDNKQELLSTSYLLEDTNSESLDWVNEINSLLKSVNSGLKLFSSVYELNSTEDVTIQIVNSIYNIFDVNNEKYEYNHGLFNDVVDGLSTSMLLGKVLETNFITKSMVGFLEQMTQGTDLYIPDNIKYANTSTEKGEIYNLFKGIEALFSNTDTKTVITDLVNGNSLTNDDFSKLCNSFLDDDEKVLNYLLSSKLVSSTVSGLLLSINIEDIQIIYPNTCKEMVDSKYVNLILKEEIKELIRMVPDLLTSLESSDQTKGIINFVVDNKDNVSQSDILCATVANYLSNSLPSELSSIIVVPNELKEAATKEELTKFEATNPWRSEIKRLLDVFEVLELNDPNLDFSNSENLTNQIIGNILELNDPLTQDLLNKYQNENYQTKLDLCYGSPIILATLTKQIDNNINEEFIDDLSKEKAKDNGNYKKIELRTLIDSLNELEITDFSNINVDDIVNKVLNLNDTAITDPKVSKLDVCYESIIIKSVIAKQLDKNLTEDLVDDSTKLSVKDSNGYYNKEEVSLLLDSLNEFEISSLENIDINEITNKVLNLNDTAITDPKVSKLDVCYSSIIIESIINKQLDDNLGTDIIDTDKRDSVKVINKYPKSEISSMLYALKELGISDITAIDITTIQNEVLNLNDPSIKSPESLTKLNVCYESKLIDIIVTKQLDDNLGADIIDTDKRNSVKVNEQYTEEEVSAILYALKELGISDITAIDITAIQNEVLNLNKPSIKSPESLTKLNVCYESKLIDIIVTKQLDDNLGADIIDTDKRNSVKVNEQYTETEVSAILYALKELGISDITAIDITTIQNEVLNLNKPSIKSPESLTKLNVCYESKLIDIIVTKQLDDNLGADIIDTDKRNSVKVNEQYTEEEVSAMLYALKEFEITNITSVEKNTITNKVPKLNNPSIKNSKITKLDVCYESELFVYIVVKQMDDSLDSNLIETSKRDSVKVDEKYTKEEMAALVSSLNELEITDLNNFDKSSIETSIVDLNKTSTIDPSKTKLELIYESMLSRYAITKQIDTNFDEELLKPNERETVKECHSFDYYIEPEVAALIDSLNELGISDVTSIDKNYVKNKITILNENADTNNEITKLDVLYGSMIVSFVIANQITPSLNSNNVHENVINYSKEEVKTEYYYKKIEIKKLIDGINAIGISTIDEVSGIGFNSGSNVLTNLNDNVKLTTFYQSYILVDILTSKLDNIVDTNNFLIYNSEAKYYNNTLTLSFYKQLEVKTLIDFINEKLGGTEFSNVDSSSITIDGAFKNYTANSKILAATMTKQIIDNPSIEVPSYTILDGEYNEGDYIIQNEMDNLIDGLITLFGTGTIDGIDLDISLDSSKINAIYNSNILNATISKQLASNAEIVIPSRVLKEATTINEITNNEVKAFLTSVTSGLGIKGPINSINSSDVKLPSGDLDEFVESDIMRATVTKNVKAIGDDPLPLFVENSTGYCEKTYAVDETNILVLSKAEVKALINAIKVLNTSDAYEINLSISTLSGLDEASLNTLLESNIIRIYVTTILKKSGITLETTDVYAYELGSTLDETVKVEIADKTAIKSALAI